jgi:hypothetical protein
MIYMGIASGEGGNDESHSNHTVTIRIDAF